MGSSYGLQKTKAEFLPNRFRLPVAGILNIKSSKRDSHWFELIGLIISDGYISKTKRSIDIYQSKSKPDVVKRIEYLISSLSLQHRRYFINNAGGAVFNYVRRNGIYCWRISGISAVKIHDFIFEGEFRRRYPIKNSTKKKFSVYKRDAAKVKIPWWMLQNATRKEKKSLLLGLMLGDGTWQTKNSGVYYTSDADLANFVQTLLVTLGYRSHLTHRTRSRLKPNYEISFSDNAWVEITTENISKVKYVGRTWCVTSEFGTIITRRNGKVLITGNSIRNDADWAKTYVLDSNASRLVSELKKFIPQAYHDALYLKT
jgi:hypothetical protein